MTTRKTLEPIDFMMMDVHRPMTDEEIDEINPQARLDKSAGPEPDDDSESAGVGASHENETYKGPFIVFPDNVAVLDVDTCHELDVDRVLQSAHDNKLARVLVIGEYEDGELYVLASDPDAGIANLMCDRAKLEFLDAVRNNRTAEDPRGPKQKA